MARSVPNWVGETDNAKVPPRVRQRIYDRAAGVCHVCCINLDGRRWEIDHDIALINGGQHDELNMSPICIPCHREKTAVDVGIKSKIAAIRAAHTGVKRPTGDLKGRGFDKVAPKEKAPQRASLPPRSLYARRDK